MQIHLGVLYLDNLWVLFGRLFIENLEEGGLPFFINSSSLPEILEECAHIFNAVGGSALRASAGMPDSPGDLLLASLVI